MTAYRSLASRFILAAGLAGTMLGAAVLPAPAAGTDPGTVAPHPITAAPVTHWTPPISDLSVEASGTQATIRFTTAEPATASLSVQPVAATDAISIPTTSALGAVTGGSPTVVESITSPKAAPTYETAHTLHLDNLKSNSAYQATVTTQAEDGTHHSQQVQINTLKERIRVTVDNIDISDNGEFIGDASPLWLLGLQWGAGAGYTHLPSAYGQASTCFPTNGGYPNGICQYGSYGDGAFQPKDTFGKPLSWVFAEENLDAMPTQLKVSAGADVSTSWNPINLLGGALSAVGGTTDDLLYGNTPSPSSTASWQVPQGVENASATLSVAADDDDFASTVRFKVELFYDNLSYPAAQHNQPTNPWANR